MSTLNNELANNFSKRKFSKEFNMFILIVLLLLVNPTFEIHSKSQNTVFTQLKMKTMTAKYAKYYEEYSKKSVKSSEIEKVLYKIF